MGATASRSEMMLQRDIEFFEASLPLAKRPIKWDDDSSMTAHSALNALHNAHYHIQSGRRGRGLRARVTAASKLICTGRVASPVVVSFDALAVDITSVTPRTVVPACDVLHCGAIKCHCSAIKRSPSWSSSTCSLDDTCPSSSTCSLDCAPASWHAQCPEQVSGPRAVDASGAEQLCHFELEEGPFEEDEEAIDLCGILTSGGRCQTSHRPGPATSRRTRSLGGACELGDHELGAFDISGIGTSSGRCLTHQVTRSRTD